MAGGAALPGCSGLLRDADRPGRPVRIGLVTDVHYADKDSKGSRHYRDGAAKLSSAIERFNEARADLVVELGDFIDSADTMEAELGYLKRIESVFAQARCPRYRVLGNHCVYSLSKEHFLAECSMPSSYYSFDFGGWHFVVLDGCFRGDGEPYGRKNYQWTDAKMPAAELAWLVRDLAATRKQTVVFIHQRLDVDTEYALANSADVRRQFDESGKVKAVFQGHHHTGDFKVINGIPYCTLAAMVDGPATTDNAFGLVELREEGSMSMQGYGRQKSLGTE